MEGLFLRVLNLSVTAGYMILAVVVMRLLLRRAPRWVICSLWALVALRLVCPVSLESAFSLIPSAETVSTTVVRSNAVPVSRTVIHSGFEVIDNQVNQMIDQATGREPASNVVPPEPTESSAPAKSATYYAAIIWVWGITLMALYGLGSWFHLRRRVSTAVWWTDNIWQCETVTTPFVLGLLCPRIYLPFSMDRQTVEHVLAHERAHIRRRDQLSKIFGFSLLAVYWFNPLLWLAYALFCKDMELACDERVIRDMSPADRQRYALALLEVGTDRPVLPACPVAFGEVGVKERILRVMKYKTPALWAICLAVILCAAAAVCLLTNPVADASEEPAAVKEPATVEEPVAYEPETVTATVTSADGVISYDIAAKVYDTPQSVPLLQIRPREITIEEAQAVVRAVFGDAEIYEYSHERTKAEMEPIIQELRATVQAFETDFESKVDYYHDKAHGMTREEAETLAASVQADFEDRLAAMEALYETASDTVEPRPCAWEYHSWSYYQDPSLFGTSTAIDAGEHRYVKATAYMNGYPYVISLCNKDAIPGENYRIHDVSVYIDDSVVSPEALMGDIEPFTQADIDATLATVERLLKDMGLDNYTISSWDGGQGYALNVTAVPVYEDTPVVTSLSAGGGINADTTGSYGGSNAYGESVCFSFLSPDVLNFLDWQQPYDVVERQNEAILSFNDAFDAFAQAVNGQVAPTELNEGDAFYEDEILYVYGDTDTIHRNINRIDFGYVRVPIGDGTGDFRLEPAYCFYDQQETELHLETGEAFTETFEYLYAIISAVDGTILQS